MPHNVRKPWQVLPVSMCQWNPELQWDNQSWRDLLASLDYVDAARFQRISLQEVVAFIIFKEKNPNDLASWFSFSDDQLLSFKVEEPIAFLKLTPPQSSSKYKAVGTWCFYIPRDCRNISLNPPPPTCLEDLPKDLEGGSNFTS